RERETRVREAPPSGCASTRVPAPVAPPLSIQSRSPSVSVDLLSSPIYFRIWARVFYRRKSSADGGFQTAVTYLSLDSWCPYQDGDVLLSRLWYSGVCSNGGGDDLALAIDLSGKDYTRVKDGGSEDGGHGLRFVTVSHVPVVAGETRPCSDVGSPGGGDVRGVAPR
ncbi:LOW QUALITY PROTEIN: hypothetical protein HID58_035214, partial [Brassica napus]